MNKRNFYWGPFAVGLYQAMLWSTLIIGWTARDYLFVYVMLLLFLGLGLKPLLLYTGIYQLFNNLFDNLDDKKWERISQERRREFELEKQRKKYKYRRQRDSKLPKNW